MNQTEFEARVLSLTQDMYRVAAGLLRSSCDRQDAIQESIWKAWRQLRYLRDDDKFRPWLMRILVNECRNLYRKKQREVPVEEIEGAGEDPHTDYDRDEALHEAMEKLPEKMRLAIILYYMDGFTTREMAQILRVPESTVKSRLRLGRIRLRELLGKEVEA